MMLLFDESLTEHIISGVEDALAKTFFGDNNADGGMMASVSERSAFLLFTFRWAMLCGH